MADTQRLPGMVPRRDRSKLGVWFFLGGEVILFTSLILTFAWARVYHGNYTDFRAQLNVPLVAVNTLVLIISSYLVVRALAAIRAGKANGLRTNLLGVIILGIMFLGGQAYEWATLFKDGVSVGDRYGTYFFTITGIHGTHVLIGVIWASFVLVSSLDGVYTADDNEGVEIFGLYWHFVDIVWIILFTLFYLVD